MFQTQPSINSKMEYLQAKQEANIKYELHKSNKSISLPSVVSCLDDNLNYTYAKSCKGGLYLFLILLVINNLNSQMYFRSIENESD
jgi:hypothetical protein